MMLLKTPITYVNKLKLRNYTSTNYTTEKLSPYFDFIAEQEVLLIAYKHSGNNIIKYNNFNVEFFIDSYVYFTVDNILNKLESDKHYIDLMITWHSTPDVVSSYFFVNVSHMNPFIYSN